MNKYEYEWWKYIILSTYLYMYILHTLSVLKDDDSGRISKGTTILFQSDVWSYQCDLPRYFHPSLVSHIPWHTVHECYYKLFGGIII